MSAINTVSPSRPAATRAVSTNASSSTAGGKVNEISTARAISKLCTASSKVRVGR